MKNKKIYFIAVGGSVLLLLTAIFYFVRISYTNPQKGLENGQYTRIISMAPNITEIVFALDLQERLVGVTDFCSYPPQAKKIAKVGGYLNPNYEALLSLKPDLVILLPEQANIEQYLTELNIPFLMVDNKKVDDILSSILSIAKKCNVEVRAEKLLANLRKRIDVVKQHVKNMNRPKVLISIGRVVGNGNLGEVYAAGKGTYYDELIDYAGGVNAVSNSLVAYPALSAEGIIRLNPDIIIDFVLDSNKNGLSEDKIKGDWQVVQRVNACKNNRLYVYDKGYMVIPGPRFVNFLEDLSVLLHPLKDEIDTDYFDH